MNKIIDDLADKAQPAMQYAGEVYGFDNNDIDVVEKKISFVWKWESLNAMRLSREQKSQFARHIISLNIPNSVICGNTNDEDYFDLVERLATGHGIKKSNSKKELYLISAASKYCGHHNRKYPFYDENNRQMLKLLGCPDCFQDFPDYVRSIRDIQQKNGLESLSLRELDYYLWSESKKIL
jgi:hypothetical protein